MMNFPHVKNQMFATFFFYIEYKYLLILFKFFNTTFQGLTDMWMWINIITNKSDGSMSPSSRPSPTKWSGAGGYSRFLYNNNNNMYEGSSYSQSSYAESDCDYSWPQSPCSTRPSSQVSVMSLGFLFNHQSECSTCFLKLDFIFHVRLFRSLTVANP